MADRPAAAPRRIASRRELGQVFTPAVVADFMVAWVLGSRRPGVFDPCFGGGAFFEAARRAGHPRFDAMEIDPEMVRSWRLRPGDARSVSLTEGDYLRTWGARRPNIVCNPPYLRFQHFPNRREVLREFERRLDLTLSGYTNAASAFLLKSLAELDAGGRLAYLLPLEFLNAGYGRVVKEQLIRSGRLSAIIELDCEKEVFPKVTTSVGLVLCDAARHSAEVAFHTVERIGDLAGVMERPPVARIEEGSLDPAAKWLLHFRPRRVRVRRDRVAPLGHYGRLSRGIATGANEFFMLRPSRAAALGLDPGETVPCIARSQQVARPFFGRDDFADLVDRDARVLLLGVDGSPSASARAYLRAGEERGFHRRFLTRHRRPWYRTEARRPAPILFGVFFRNGYKVVRNRSGAVNLTCFHGFQPNVFGAEFVDSLFLYLASGPGRQVVSLAARRYGDALDKFEPGDLMGAAAPDPQRLSGLCPADRERALEHLGRTGETPAWLDRFFEEVRSPTPARAAVPSVAWPAAADGSARGASGVGTVRPLRR